jgi:hypothetical protein
MKLVTRGSGIGVVIVPKLSTEIFPFPPATFAPKNRPISSGASRTLVSDFTVLLFHAEKLFVMRASL